MTLNDIITLIIDFVREHESWAMPIVFILAFGESLAFLSLLLPATVILLGLGALIGESGISFWPIWAAATAGAFFGVLGWCPLQRPGRHPLATLSQSPVTRAWPCILRTLGILWCFYRPFLWPITGCRSFGCRYLRHAKILFPIS